jgi:hypothetical protein
MNTDMHPDTDTLKTYLRNIESPEFDTLRLHLVQCESCRNELSALSALDRFYPALDESASSETSRQQDILDYVDDRLPARQRADVAAQIENDTQSLKAALRYALHSSSMKAELDAGQNTRANSADVSQLSKLFASCARLFELRATLWAAVPATAAVVAVVAFSVPIFVEQPGSEYLIASYRDNPVIQFSNNQARPGIGFFSQAGQSSSAYDNVQLSITDAGRLTIDWPKIKHALSYNLRLQVFRQKHKAVVGEVTTTTPSASFQIDPEDVGRRFEWVLSGSTREQMTFYTTGGFVIDKTGKAGTD